LTDVADQIITFEPDDDPINKAVVGLLESAQSGYANAFTGYTYIRRPDGSSELRLQRA
jgi:hypothetical protein